MVMPMSDLETFIADCEEASQWLLDRHRELNQPADPDGRVRALKKKLRPLVSRAILIAEPARLPPVEPAQVDALWLPADTETEKAILMVKQLLGWARGLGATPASGEKTAAASVSVDAPQWDKNTEARNKWLYEQCKKGKKYSAIIADLKNKPKSWARLEHPNSIKKAAEAYATRKQLQPIPRRRRRRPVAIEKDLVVYVVAQHP